MCTNRTAAACGVARAISRAHARTCADVSTPTTAVAPASQAYSARSPLPPRALALEDRRDGRPDPGAERRVPPRVRHHVEVPPPEAVPVHDRRDALGGRDLEGDPRLRHARRHADRGALRDAHGVDPLDALPPPAARRRPEAELVHQVQFEPERDAVQDAVLAGLERQARLARRERRLDVRGAEVELGAGHRRRQEPVRARPRLHRAVQVQLLGPRRYRSSAARGTPCDAGNRAASGAQKTRARAGTTTHSGTARWRRAWRT